MGSTIILDSKLDSETITLTYDASSMLRSGESVSGVNVQASLLSGYDSDPTQIISGSASVASNIVTQNITGGVTGDIYLLRITLTTSAGNIYIVIARLAVLGGDSF